MRLGLLREETKYWLDVNNQQFYLAARRLFFLSDSFSMITRSGATRRELGHDDTLAIPRQALFEELSLLNKAASKGIRQNGDMKAPARRREATKIKGHIISTSPARREPRALQSPARRSVVRSPSRSCLVNNSVDLLSSPSKRLGAPRRGQSSQSAVCFDETLLYLKPSVTPLPESMLALNKNSRVRPLEESSASVEQAQTSVPVSPLKKPPRRVQVHVHLAESKTTSIAHASDVRTPIRYHKPRTRDPTTVELSTANDDTDELASPTPSEKFERKSEVRRTQRAIPSRSPAPRASQPTHLSGDDVDELAILSFTPLKVPDLPSHAVSPPSEEIFEDEDDHWCPSVPSGLTKSLAELSLLDSSSTGKFSNVKDQSSPATSLHSKCASDMVIYVDCKTTDQGESSRHFSSLLATLGARVVERWNWNPDTQGTPSKRSKVIVTHVVFFNGSTRTLKKVNSARKLGIPVTCIGLSWVTQCALSERLTIGTAGHEIDVAHEMVLRGATSKAIDPQPLIDDDHKRSQVLAEIPVTLKAQPTAHVADVLVPVVFDDTHSADGKHALLLTTPPKLTASFTSPAKSTPKTKYPHSPCMTDFESRNILLARRNSAKFQPVISSPLSKRAWKA